MPIAGARRCAAQSWPVERFLAIKQAAGVSLNVVVLAVCGGAVRAYLIEQDALPDKSLIANRIRRRSRSRVCRYNAPRSASEGILRR